MIATLYDVAARHGFSNEAAVVALDALRRGLGGMAQFDHPDLGGHGQWMNGMVMVGRTGDAALKARVGALFADLTTLAAGTDHRQRDTMEPMKPMQPMKPMAPMRPMEGTQVDAPKDWGEPAAAGGQNDVRYAYFDKPHRLVVERHGQRTVYDTAGHAITGVAQDQSAAAAGRLVFTSRDGPVAVESLKVV